MKMSVRLPTVFLDSSETNSGRYLFYGSPDGVYRTIPIDMRNVRTLVSYPNSGFDGVRYSGISNALRLFWAYCLSNPQLCRVMTVGDFWLFSH